VLNNIKLKSTFSKNVFTLFTGTALAQIIPVAISPILTRLYEPEDFGLLAIYLSIVSIMCVVATCRYEMAIMLPKTDNEVNSIVKLIFSLITFTAFISFIIVLFYSTNIAVFFGNPELANWLYLLPISIFLTSTSQTFTYLLIRNKNFKQLAINKVFASSTNVSLQLSVGATLNTSWGLLLGNIASILISILVIIKSKLIAKYFFFTDCEINKAAKKYKKFPLFDVPSVLLNLCANQLPLLVLGKFFGLGILGAYSFMYKTLMMPVNLISTSILDVFKQKATEDFNRDNNCRKIYVSTFMKLVCLATPIFSILGVFAPELFSMIFGNKWRLSGEFAQIMAPMFFFNFIANPLSYTFFIAGKQNINLRGQVLILLFSTISVITGVVLESAFAFVCAFSFLNSIIYLLYIMLSYRYSKGINDHKTT